MILKNKLVNIENVTIMELAMEQRDFNHWSKSSIFRFFCRYEIRGETKLEIVSFYEQFL